MNWPVVAIELAVCGWIAVLLAGDALLTPRFAGLERGKRQRRLWSLAMLGIGVLAWVLGWQSRWLGQAFGPMFLFDGFAFTFKWLFLITTAVVIAMMRQANPLAITHLGEFYLLIFSALLGMLVLASINDLLLLFIALELLTFSLYVMAAYVKTDPRSIEAGMKYLIMGSVSSGFLVYGISLLYGAAGGTGFEALRALLASGPAGPNVLAGLFLVLAGLGFKVAAVPFHLWVPDVYEGAPTPVVALLSVGSKMAGMIVLLRLLYSVALPVAAVWTAVLAALSAATLLYGNLAAIPQTNVKRLLGYSSIGHAGYLLMGLCSGLLSGAQAVGFYLLAYLVSTLAAFFVVMIVPGDSLEEYNGLSHRSPFLAAAMFVALLSLAGVPPLAGFVGKLLVLLSAVESHRLWLAAIGGLNVAISLYYYLCVVRRMYLLKPASSKPIAVDGISRAVLFLLLLGIVIIGTVQEPFLRLLSSAIAF
ncbi:MAG: hypothetical protein A3I71_04820 [Omnitrophica WOR_2 bacterium RIFCSPLOWO2_02_FULL_63_16]|nr:MAG: hypothetical protein A2Z92_06655 [Omnitrophica WOR_2 bacterium GWA2_63_20]OGX17055.1 MAG: hypothetical protein A2105_04370 [Omnitrophica WOR_2 bacterium GWF2_63_9]OGX34899.1 MAG: hypothetical protein A3B73_03790 [Omnitrophica WOR_2 bacterium RIFCSPHIGHO2_02_FULL_63_39]OGX46497.1 MAG: hypothetical protein A3I71_04820 [Omnitrophica WOR_2 bacterium RIFCSPLOWO2_02_FULL_63_16]OGX47500.1 MAG: hypothetical protein A3G88_00515 [Omnitrophica WOR_2 bacterium RIFCSPLOWO2_12_FULL_63_16]HBQ38752.1 